MKLGNPNGAEALRRAGKGSVALWETIARDTDRHARDIAPVVAASPPTSRHPIGTFEVFVSIEVKLF